MDCKNTDNKHFFVVNARITSDDMSSLSDQKVDHVGVQLPITFNDYQKKKYIQFYNSTTELINNRTNITPKYICLRCNLAIPSTYYRTNPRVYTFTNCGGQLNRNKCWTCFKCGDCNKWRDYTDHSDCQVNKNVYN
jgi:hypothetical protein